MLKLLLIVFCFFSSLNLYAQWLDVPVPGIGKNFRVTQAQWIDSANIIGHDGDGKIVVSTDAGNSYSSWSLNLFLLGSISQPSVETGYLVYKGLNQLLKSTDTWQNFTPMLITDGIDTAFQSNPILFCHFWDENRGFVLGDSLNGSLDIWTTSNGGLHWKKVLASADIGVKLKTYISNVSSPCFNEFEDGGILAFPGESRFYFKIDTYGEVWKKIELSQEYHFNGFFAFKNLNEGLIIRNLISGVNQTRLAYTSNGGSTWDTSYMFDYEVSRIEFAKSSPNYPEVYVLCGGLGTFIIRSLSEPPIQVDSKKLDNISFYNSERGTGYYPVDDQGLGARVFSPKIISTGTEKLANRKINLYPNPNHGEFIFFTEESEKIQIIDLYGRVVYEKFTLVGENRMVLKLQPGLYLLKVDGYDAQRFVVSG